MADLPPPPPNRKGGWYPDPEGSGRLRFWNKTRWTDDFKDAPRGAKAVPKKATSKAVPKKATSKKTSTATGGADSEPSAKRGQWAGAPWWAWFSGAFVVI